MPDSEHCYVLGKIVEVQDDGTVLATTLDGRTVSAKKFATCDKRDATEEDLVHMVNVDTPNILNTLRERHAAGTVYTAVGQAGILISINPYRWIDGLYETTLMRDHYDSFGTRDLAPHVFALASDAYKALCVYGSSQVIVTSGESGSGKTENSKQCFRFLAEIAGGQHGGGGSEASVMMQELLIASNPVLEAFGNAKTQRNDNSSRFGKLVTVHFDGSGRIMGAQTRNYLLERTRVHSAPCGERNYHAFYQLLMGGAVQEKTSRHLKGDSGAFDYALLRGGVRSAAGMDDAAEWRATCAALRQLGFTDEEQAAMFHVVAALLHLGNCEFVADGAVAHGDDAAKLKSPEPVERAAELLGAERMAFVGAMTGVRVRDLQAEKVL